MSLSRFRGARYREWVRGSCVVLMALAHGCGGPGSEPHVDAGSDGGNFETCCIDNRYALCPCYHEHCDGPFIANCGGGVCANFFPATPMSDPCEGVE